MNNNQDDDETLTPEEKQFADELDLKITEAQQKLDKIGLTQSRLDWLEKTMKKKQQENTMTPEEKQEKFQEMADKAIDIPTIDRQGRKIFTLEETINNYNNAWGVLKYRELPICWSNLKEKIKFSVPMAFMAAYAYEAIQLKKMNISLFDMKYRLLGRTWGLFMIFGTAFCTLDSILFDDFCDINSYHYQTRDRKKLIRELRSQLINKPTKNEGEN